MRSAKNWNSKFPSNCSRLKYQGALVAMRRHLDCTACSFLTEGRAAVLKKDVHHRTVGTCKLHCILKKRAIHFAWIYLQLNYAYCDTNTLTTMHIVTQTLSQQTNSTRNTMQILSPEISINGIDVNSPVSVTSTSVGCPVTSICGVV